MQALSSLAVVAATFVLSACVAMAPMGSGKHLVYRDTAGTPAMQIDYPTEAFCRRVEAVASGNARCQEQSLADQLHARATLHYNPPGMTVEAHYADLLRCYVANGRMATGVELLQPCTAK